MKGKYHGCRMTIYGTLLPGASAIARSAALADELTDQAKSRLKILDWHRAHGGNQSLTARHFGIGRMTLIRWLKRFAERGIIGLNELSREPKRLREPSTPWLVVARAVALRKQYPAWSKYKLAAMLKREGIAVSASTVGRILKRKGLINLKVSRKRRRSALRPKFRFPKGLRVHGEGELIQMDTKHIMLPGGRKFFQFTAIDVLTKRRVLRVYPSQSSRNGVLFLVECLVSFPYPIVAVQTDNGAPFQKEFDRACRDRGITHYFIHPHTPKENTYVERSHGTDELEFYQQGNISSLLPVMRRKIMAWEEIWNTVRPHESLGQLTPCEYSLKIKTNGLPTKNVVILQT
ncbi:MAG: transposase [Patescibacteria group bacterium]|nr:transposase [Patescibacteria group bacterium]